jgi:hypothetical protein
MPPRTAPQWREAIADASRHGDQLLAYDLSVQALDDFPDEIGFDYTAILALARSGVTEGAKTRYDSMAGRIGAITDPVLACDFATLAGRLWKDRAAVVYEAAYRRFGGAYPAINAATCHLASGQTAAAQAFAGLALEATHIEAPDYWATATRVEALLILNRAAEAANVARALPPSTLAQHDAVATTRRQLALVTSLCGVAFDLALLPAPHVLFWPSSNTPVTSDQAQAVLSNTPAIIFLPLLAAADLATTTSLADAGARVHLVLPCAPQTWRDSHPDGPALTDAFQAALACSAEPMVVTVEGGVHEPAARLLCQRQAVGLAVLRARALAVPAQTVHLTGAGYALAPLDAKMLGPADPVARSAHPAALQRLPCAIVFGDVRGFSKLSEAGQLQFLHSVIGGFASVLAGYNEVQYAETAGDGLYVVLSDVAAAAACCFALRDVLAPARIAASGLPPHLALRLSAHAGPLHRRYDPVIRRDKFCGMEVIRTARIEPVTPAGEIFVTEQFAALLAHDAPDAYVCEYAGQQPMAKGFGTCRMYSLRQAVS